MAGQGQTAWATLSLIPAQGRAVDPSQGHEPGRGTAAPAIRVAGDPGGGSCEAAVPGPNPKEWLQGSSCCCPGLYQAGAGLAAGEPAAAGKAVPSKGSGWARSPQLTPRGLGLPPPSAPACAPSTRPPSSSAGAPQCPTWRASGGSSSAWTTCMWILQAPVGARTSCTSPTLG